MDDFLQYSGYQEGGIGSHRSALAGGQGVRLTVVLDIFNHLAILNNFTSFERNPGK
jgi:hypothetical protein